MTHVQLRAKGTYFVWKTQGKAGKMKLKIDGEPVIIDWHNISF